MAEEFPGGEDEGAAPAVLDGRGGQGVGGMRLVPLGSPKGADPFLQPWADPALALVRGGGASSPLRVRATQVGGGQLVLDPGDLAVEDRQKLAPLVGGQDVVEVDGASIDQQNVDPDEAAGGRNATDRVLSRTSTRKSASSGAALPA
ncbi:MULTISPECIES: hypothetical protein [Methylobacterium]|uniref:hypothetical protein n=1 Tax=Methylobacterium TaxID=407 RepID=UPI00272ECCD1|nr:hypothetical protein [Methylobacterium sp.]